MGRSGWVGAVCTFWYECPLVVIACESLHVCTVCIWRCEHARFCVEVFYALYINFHSFIRWRNHLWRCLAQEGIVNPVVLSPVSREVKSVVPVGRRRRGAAARTGLRGWGWGVGWVGFCSPAAVNLAVGHDCDIRVCSCACVVWK